MLAPPPATPPCCLRPAYGAVAWLAAAALGQPIGPRARWTGAVPAAVVGATLAGGCFYLVRLYGDASDVPAAILAALLLVAAGLGGGHWLGPPAPPRTAPRS